MLTPHSSLPIPIHKHEKNEQSKVRVHPNITPPGPIIMIKPMVTVISFLQVLFEATAIVCLPNMSFTIF